MKDDAVIAAANGIVYNPLVGKGPEQQPHVRVAKHGSGTGYCGLR